MPPAIPALQREPETHVEPQFNHFDTAKTAARPSPAESASVTPIRPVPVNSLAQPRKSAAFRPRIPPITGEALYRGTMPVDGIITGQLGAAGSTMSVKQRPRNGDSEPELDGEIIFKDMLRINGHVAGKISSTQGTLIVDGSARVDASIDVAICVVSGTVNGDVIAQERVELGPAAIVRGDICTSSLAMKPGAIFTGNCRMLKNGESAE
jgi:cytoskeletal protein CcmA (bactofilin family)